MHDDHARAVAAAPAAPPAALPASAMLVLGSLTILGPLGTDAFLPALPAMSADLGAPGAQIQLSLSGFTVGMAVGMLIAGPLSDGVGRRRPLVVGSLMMVAGGVAASLAPSLAALVACCVLMGLGASVCAVVSRAVVADSAEGPPLARAYSLLGTLTGLGPIAGPLSGVVAMALWGWRGIFALLAVLGAIGCAGVLLRLPETRPPQARLAHPFRSMPSGILRALRSRPFRRAAAVLVCAFGGLFAYISASSFLVQSVLGLPPIAYSIVFGANGLALTAAGVVAGRLARTMRPFAIVAIGLAIQAAGALLALATALTGTATPWTLLPALALIAGSFGLIFGTATAAAVEELRDIAGTALAVCGAAQFAAAGLVSPLVGLGGEHDPRPFAITAAVCVALAWASWILLRGRGSAPEPTAAPAGPEHEGARHGTA